MFEQAVSLMEGTCFSWKQLRDCKKDFKRANCNEDGVFKGIRDEKEFRILFLQIFTCITHHTYANTHPCILPPLKTQVYPIIFTPFQKCWRVCVLGFVVYVQDFFFFVGLLLLVELLPLAFVIFSGLHELLGASLALALLVAGSLHSDDLIVETFFH
jgi:hypothetical protein